MDGSRFDDAVKAFAGYLTRRGLSRAILGGLGLGLLSRAGVPPLETRAKEGRPKKPQKRTNREVRADGVASGLTIEVLAGTARNAIVDRASTDGGFRSINAFISVLPPGYTQNGSKSQALRVRNNGQHIRDVWITEWDAVPTADGFTLAVYGEESTGEVWRNGSIIADDVLTDVLLATPSRKKKKRKKGKGKKGKGKTTWSVARASVSPQQGEAGTRLAAVRGLDDGTSRCGNCRDSCEVVVGLVGLVGDVAHCGKVVGALCPSVGSGFFECAAEIGTACLGVLNAIDELVFDPLEDGACEIGCNVISQCEPCPPQACGPNEFWDQDFCRCSCQVSPGIQRCGGACVDTRSNRNHCGGCGNGCTASQECSDGECVDTCEPEDASTTCGARGCGPKINNCDQAIECGGCEEGERCQAGQCEPIDPCSGEPCPYEFVTEWGSFGTGSQFYSPSGVAVDNVGSVYVSEIDKIQKFDSVGKMVASWRVGESSTRRTAGLNGIAVDSAGAVYVVDSHSHQVQKFDGNGTFVTAWGTHGDEGGEFDYPYGIAVDLSTRR